MRNKTPKRTAGNDPAPERLVPYDEVLDRVPVNRSTLWRMRQKGEFPEPVKIGARRVAWRESDLTRWMDR
jgi:prophage regulatory protein